MPKDDKRKELTQEEIDAQNEKFRTFFSTSVAQVPEEMKRRDEEKENIYKTHRCKYSQPDPVLFLPR